MARPWCASEDDSHLEGMADCGIGVGRDRSRCWSNDQTARCRYRVGPSGAGHRAPAVAAIVCGRIRDLTRRATRSRPWQNQTGAKGGGMDATSIRALEPVVEDRRRELRAAWRCGSRLVRDAVGLAARRGGYRGGGGSGRSIVAPTPASKSWVQKTWQPVLAVRQAANKRRGRVECQGAR